MISSQKDANPSELAQKIEERLRKHKGQDEGKENFYIQTFADALATFSVITNIINSVLVLIALISVIVAAVNIMNTMYTTILERTKEIGVMKAIGATNKDIIYIFMTESAIIGIIGGIIGSMLGYMAAKTGGQLALNAGFGLLKPIFPFSLVLGCLLFSSLIGLVSGILPSMQASKLKPVDALRYE